MKKCLVPLILVAFATFFAILSACGEGEPIDLANRGIEFTEVDKARNELRTVMEGCKLNPNQTICQSLSSGGEPSGGNSSSGGESSGGNSSSGGEPSGGSSSSNSPPVICNAAPICAMLPELNTVVLGAQIQPAPRVMCGPNNEIPTNQITWIPADRIFTNPEDIGVGKQVFAQVAGNNQPVSCGTITVTPAPTNSYPDFNFACSWTPNSVLAGDPTQVNISIDNSTPKLETDCKREAWLPIKPNDPNPDYRDTAYFEVGVNIPTAGTIIGKRKQEQPNNQWLPDTAWPSPLSGSSTFSVKGTLTCKDNDHVARSKTIDCATLTLRAPPGPSASSGTITFNGASSSPNIYFIGDTVKFSHNIANISNNLEARCDTVMTKISGGGVNGVNDSAKHAMSVSQIAIPQTAQSMAASKGFPAVTTDQNVTASVIAICRGKQYTLATATAKVVPNPSLSGSCSWTAPNGSALSSPNRTTPATGAIPGGVTLANSYGRCGSLTDAALPASAYGGNGKSPWPSNGSGLSEKLYDSVTTNVTCAPSVSQRSCPELNVTSIVCNANLNNVCPGATWETVNWNGITFGENGAIPSGCYFVESVSGDMNMNGGSDGSCYFRTNGTCRNGQISSATANANKVDGGVYIYVPPNTGWSNRFPSVATGAPFCHDPVEKIRCSGMPAITKVGASLTAPTTRCHTSTGGTPTGLSWSPSVNWSNIGLSAGNHTINVTGTCSGRSLSGSCGTLTVEAPKQCANTNIATYCGNGFNWANLITSGTFNGVPPIGCYFTLSMGSLQIHNNNSNVTFYINGTTRNKDNCKDDQCTNGIAKVDGGYYLSLRNSADGSYYTTPFTASEPNCTGGVVVPPVDPPGGTCEYQSSYCNGVAPVLGSTTRPTATGCWFISDYSSITTASGGGSIYINNSTATANCTGATNACPAANTITKKDGGYYVSLRSGGFSSNPNGSGWNVTAATSKPAACSW